MTTGIQALIDVMARLRDPENGCPWDIVQTFDTIAPYTIEEAYEVADAIRLKDMAGLKEELGDLLLQVVYHARMAEEAGLFTFDDVAAANAQKMIDRHPHVYAKESANTPGDVKALWDDIKDKEKLEKGKVKTSIMDDIPLALPAIMRAEKIQKRAARVGFEWKNTDGVFAKLDEEMGELHEAIASNDPKEIAGELGDVLFSVVNLGRMLGVDCEEALRKTNDKFINRFSGMEDNLKVKNKEFSDFNLDQLEDMWIEQKRKEK